MPASAKQPGTPAALSTAQLAVYLNISYDQVNRLRRAGVLPAPLPLGKGRHRRWGKAAIDRWLAGEPLVTAGGRS
jgi:excisionase family DNA binding protein